MPFCPSCGKEVSEGITFCPECGERLKKGVTPEEKQKYIQELEAPVKEEKPAEKAKTTKKKLAGGIAVLIIAVIIIIAAVAICTPTELPSLTASEQNYCTTIVDHSSTVGEAMDNLRDLMGNAQIGDDEWTLDVATQLTIIRQGYDEALEIEPPSSMADIHYHYTQAMWHYDKATDLIAEGIDTINADLINQAGSEIEAGTEYINEATKLLSDFAAAHSH
jgi:hypothetical protein